MKRAILMSLTALVLLTHEALADKMALVVEPYVQIFKDRKPGSEMIKQAAKGEKFMVSKVGDYWVEVYVPPSNEKGWIELGVENPKVKIVDEVGLFDRFGSLIYLLIILAAVGGGFFVLRHFQHAGRKKALEHAGGH